MDASGAAFLVKLDGFGVSVDIVGDGERGGRWEVWHGWHVAVLRCATREASGGGRGRKVDGRCRNGTADGGLEDTGIGMDELAGGRARVGA